VFTRSNGVLEGKANTAKEITTGRVGCPAVVEQWTLYHAVSEKTHGIVCTLFTSV